MFRRGGLRQVRAGDGDLRIAFPWPKLPVIRHDQPHAPHGPLNERLILQGIDRLILNRVINCAINNVIN